MSGWLRVVGIGPGPADWITPEASVAIAAASDVVGYSTYVDRVALSDGQRRHTSGNGDELERARHALELAQQGAKVALISGGDPGVFAMAAAVFEALPLLKRARAVAVVAAGETDEAAEGIADVAAWLARHGIESEQHWLSARYGEVGETLLRFARNFQAGLTVAGAFSHSLGQERVFGGVTMDLLHRSDVPVLFAH